MPKRIIEGLGDRLHINWVSVREAYSVMLGALEPSSIFHWGLLWRVSGR